MNLKEAVKQLWIRKIEKDYNRLLSRRKISYDAWVSRQEAEALKAAGGQSDRKIEKGDYVLFLQKKGVLNQQAHIWICGYFAEHPEAQILYGDEDFLSEQGVREDPWYKPCWSPDLYLCQFYPGSVIAVRRSFLKQMGLEEICCGEIFEKPEQIRTFLDKCILAAGGFKSGCDRIHRCPHILFHITDRDVWKDYLDQGKNQGIFQCEKANDISVIIPSKDNHQILKTCLESLQQIPGLEILVVDNGSSRENRSSVDELLRNLKGKGFRNLGYIYEPMAFHFSRMCNLGAEAATGRYLLFLNDDIEASGDQWIYAMREKAAQPYVGAVGLKLYYPDSVKIQHAGINNLPVGPVHKMQFAEDDKCIYFDRNRADVNCLAVTGACLMIENEKYREAGGFPECLPVAYNDVDLGFSLYEAGYQNVVLNGYFGYHHESLSRGADTSREKAERLTQEREKLYERHPVLRNRDPYYPSGLSMDGLDSRIVPEYIHARNQVQTGILQKIPYRTSEIREDTCVFLGMEQSKDSIVKGYGVVLGDNNACYDRYVVLAKAQFLEDGEHHLLEQGFMIKTTPQYRQDLEENMPDQTNVALCGFHVQLPEAEKEKLDKGMEYAIGVLAVHKINKGKLLNWSGRYFTI